jgi:putative flippase GtrA
MSERRRVLRYLLAGGFNTAATFALYAGLVFVGVGYQLANVAGWVMGLLMAYAWSRWFVFRDAAMPARTSSQFARFSFMHAASYAASAFLLYLLIERWGCGKIAAQAVVIPFIVLLNFSASKYIVFRPA